MKMLHCKYGMYRGKGKHFTAISIGLYSLNCLANINTIFFLFCRYYFVESAYNNLHLAEKKSCVTSSTAKFG